MTPTRKRRDQREEEEKKSVTEAFTWALHFSGILAPSRIPRRRPRETPIARSHLAPVLSPRGLAAAGLSKARSRDHHARRHNPMMEGAAETSGFRSATSVDPQSTTRSRSPLGTRSRRRSRSHPRSGQVPPQHALALRPHRRQRDFGKRARSIVAPREREKESA